MAKIRAMMAIGGGGSLEWLTPKMSQSGSTVNVTFEKDVKVVIVLIRANTGYVASWTEDTGEYRDSDLSSPVITNVSGASVTVSNPFGHIGYTCNIYAYA